MPRKMTRAEFVQKAKNVHNNFYDYNLVNYTNNYTKICIVCPSHGEFWQRPGLHLTGQTCFTCSLAKKPACQKMTQDIFIETSKKIHDNKYDYSKIEYVGSNGKITIICPIHGEFSQKAVTHIIGHGCPKCGIVMRSKSHILGTENFVELAKIKHGDRYDYSKTVYIDNRTPVRIICKKHGEFYQTPNNHTTGSGCSRCVKVISNMETRWLDNIGVPNDPKHRNVKIKRVKGYFRVDGFDPTTNTVYEFYGDLWHGNPDAYNSGDFCKATKKTFGEMFSKTIQKEVELKRMGYKLITIWEKDYKKLYDEK